MKHRKANRKLTNKQALTIVIAVACAIALLIGLLIIVGPILGGNNEDPHAGHDHSSNAGDGHYEGDGHDHGDANAKVKYQIYTNSDNTYRVVFRDSAGKQVAEFDKLDKLPIKETIDKENGIYELGWAIGQGPSDYESVFYNEKTGQVSDKFTAARGTDGVRIAYGSKDQKTVIVQDLFNKEAYYKEYPLANAVEKNGNVITGGKLQVDKKTVVISYNSSDNSAPAHATIKLYE